jgi:hypothetical protein
MGGAVQRSLVLVAAAMTLSACGAESEEPALQQPAVGKAQSGDPTVSGSPDSAYFSQERMNPRRFLRRWEAASDRMQVTGRTAAYAAMTSGRVPCSGFVETVQRVYEEGGTVDFAGSTIVRIAKVGGSDSTYLVTKDVSPTAVHHGDGRLEKFPGGRTTFRVVLEPDRGAWVVSHFWIEPN